MTLLRDLCVPNSAKEKDNAETQRALSYAEERKI